jgi:hypothetical protein
VDFSRFADAAAGRHTPRGRATHLECGGAPVLELVSGQEALDDEETLLAVRSDLVGVDVRPRHRYANPTRPEAGRTRGPGGRRGLREFRRGRPRGGARPLVITISLN